jgi:hypothetical protein
MKRIADMSKFINYHIRIKFSSYSTKQCFSSMRIKYMEIIYEVLKSVEDVSVLENIPQMFYTSLVNWFFEYNFNSIYQTLFFKIFRVLMKLNYTPSLQSLIVDTNLIERMVENFSTRDGIESVLLI